MIWAGGLGSSSYDVYVGTDETLVENATDTSSEYMTEEFDTDFDPSSIPLDYATTYYWRVDAISSAGTAKGLVWHKRADQW